MNFKPLENDRPFAKIAFEGFAGDGKTYTAAQIAIGIHKLIGSKKPIAAFDTEKAIKALKPLFNQHGVPVVVDNESRSLASLNAAIKWCEEGNADILLIDSITHVWEAFVEAYKRDKKRTFIQFQDWGIIKPMWKEQFSTPFVLGKVHIIFTGRAGYEYSNEVNEDTKKTELIKSGIKMKAETETAFEPDMLILMEKVQEIIGKEKKIWRMATVLKDRTTQIDGMVFNADGANKGPSFEDFYPAIAQLLDGTISDQTGGEIPDTFQDWESKFSQIGKARSKAISEIEGTFNLMKLGTSAADKQLKAAILKKIWSVVSIESLESMRVDKLNKGLEVLKAFADRYDEYMASCIEETKTPDNKHIGNMLAEVIANQANPIAALFDNGTKS